MVGGEGLGEGGEGGGGEGVGIVAGQSGKARAGALCAILSLMCERQAEVHICTNH